MKKSQLSIILMIACCFQVLNSKAQCLAGQTDVQIDVTTDAYGYECYWQLVPSGNNCGVSTIAEGGNTTQIGCTGGGDQDATTAFGYADNLTISEGPWCLDSALSFDLIYVDDYGDGGATFTVYIDGYPMYQFTGIGVGNTFTFTTTPPYPYDAGIISISTPIYVLLVPIDIGGQLFNYGTVDITTIDINYSINNGTAVTESLTGLGIAPYTSYSYIFGTSWIPATAGTYTIKAWSGNINGSADMNSGNDTMIITVVAGEPVANVIDNYLVGTPSFTPIATSADGVSAPRDLDFATILSDYELWIINKGTENSGGKTVTIYNAGLPGQTSDLRQDGNAWHFMSLPTGIAFSDNGNFATSPGVQDANHGSGHYTGPTLWDPALYSVPNNGNGSHVDMLHQSPYSMGIAADHENKFWVYNGWSNTLDYYDFQIPHEAGGEDHSDGIVRRYSEITFDRIDDNIVNHMVLDKETGWLYMVDNGNTRVLRMDVNSGSATGTFTLYGESVEEHSVYTGVTYATFIDSGLVKPAGIDVIGDRLLVSDYSNGDIIIYDNSGIKGIELGRIHTGSSGIQGIKIGPDGKIWYVNQTENKVYRAEYDGTGAEEVNSGEPIFVYPNPSDGIVHVSLPESRDKIYSIRMLNMIGREIFQSRQMTGGDFNLNLENETAGTYFLEVNDGFVVIIKKIVLTR
ncbi:MAG: T9SS type A sorting domain-containing protein [Chitinophagales bacterium]